MNTPFQPPTGLTNIDSVFSSPGRWANGSLARFFQKGWQVKHGWERLMLDNLGGVCRSTLGWMDNTDQLNVGYGLHNGLKVSQGGFLWNITPTAFAVGQVDGTGGAGYGTGTYGGPGSYGSPSTSDYFPLTWSLSTYGSFLIANPRHQTIFQWDTIASHKATPVPNAPANVTYTLCTPQRQIMALGCNEEVSGAFNHLCIRWSDIEDITDWTTASNNNAGEWILESGGRIVCGRMVGDYAFVWTLDGLFLGTFVGAPGQTWKFERIGSQCGSISPGAPIIKSQVAVWIGPDRTFWSCALGGAPTVIDCEVRSMFADHITIGQEDKIVGGSDTTYSELTWFYPDDRDGFECSRAMTYSPDGWSRDLLPRSALVDSGPQPYPVGVSPSGSAYWHDKGHSDDGNPLIGYIESADFYLSEAEGGVMVEGMWPDFIGQQGALQLTVYTREFPQAPQRVHGPYALAPGQSHKCFRVSGRIARVRFDWNTSPAYARGGKPEFETSPIGGR